ncbi:dmX-like protein 2 isoform X2 [Phymastichus coffea]|uniref:dmX-like protein 2 isoform X2 n=1 Tax=Phymastichus coffea TaxID=108790 RepID=UPI00273B3E58|nr:dmX-like protein 2 isoform X2 [Phymastichus coffea]
MNCHQILSGACNAGDRCYAVGSVEGISFTAYAAGCNIVILASNFERVQIIPGAVHNYIRISCLDCSTDTGKIAAAYENQVCIFEPTPLIHNTCSHQLEYRWVQTGSLQTESNITSLSWNLEGTRLLTGGELLQLWHQNIQPFQEEQIAKPKVVQSEETAHTTAEQNVTVPGNTTQDPGAVTFSIGGEAESPQPTDINLANEPGAWNCVWKCRTATPVHLMSFSPDGTLFATTGMNDRLVKIWFENKQLFPSKSLDPSNFSQQISSDSFSFVYVAHPRAVTHISWRKTSKYMPKGSVSNMLVTSCRDNICRVWTETIPPEIEGLANMSQFEGTDRHGHHGKHRHHSMHKHRFMQRLKHMKTCFHIRRHAKQQQHQAGHTAPTLPTLPSTYSVHDFHNNYYQSSGHYPGMHFHLAASINAETDIPLVPSLITDDPEREPNFILHWLNNKEMQFTMQAEHILQELTRKVVEKEEGIGHHLEGDHIDHDSEDEHTPKKGARHISTQKTNIGGRTTSQEDHSSDEHHTAHTASSHHSLPHSAQSHQTLSNTTSINSIATDAATTSQAPDSLDTKIETLLRDWHHNPDLLFSIHPIDGSFLIWHIEWLDEYHPGSFRQAQISFSTRIPNAFPLGDASTMSHNVSMYSHNTGGPLLNIREVAKSSTVSKPIETTEATTPLPSLIEQDEDQSTLTSRAGAELMKNVQNGADQLQHTTTTTGLTTQNGQVQTEAQKQAHENNVNDMLTHPSPMVSMVSKHNNGTLNLWQLTFADKTKFSQVLSIGHAIRASGHRFRVNDITCHPVLPLLLTTSHHNILDFPAERSSDEHDENKPEPIHISPLGFCSELILWRVDAVGPLSKSGGVSELARINSPEISAFSNVAWIPTLLPSTTLGNLSNSPSACFVASDGECLRVYQAVIDARTLLAEVSISERRSKMMDSMASLSTDVSSDDGVRHSIHDRIKLVSQQSTARPGCIIQLDAISDATHDWQNTQFLHVFQEQLITGERNDEKLPGIDTSYNDLGLMESTLDAMVDLQQSSIFEEPFYIVVLERTAKGTTVHMWRLVIASQPESMGLTGSMMYVPDSQLVQDEDEEGTPARYGEGGRRSRRPSQTGNRSRKNSQAEYQEFMHRRHHNSHVLITTTKVCTQELPIPDGVELVHAAPAAGHLSSSSIYPACFAPYIIVTACSDSTVRFWKCKINKISDEPGALLNYEWCEWDMIRKDKESTIDITGQPLNISAAYSGRIACAYKYGKSFTRPTKADPDSRYVNLCVAIYECESTGGSEWILEDTIHLKNIHLPRIQVDQHLDLSYLYDSRFLQKKQRLTQVLQTLSHEDVRSPRNGENGGDSTKAGLLAVPSFSTLQSLRKSIIENGNTCPLTQKHLVQLDWVSKEDGSHILTVAVGSKIMLFTPVCSDLAQANMKAMKESQSSNRPILRKTSSLAQPQFVDEIRWMKLRKIELTTADGLPPLPMQISWVRDGILVVGMDSEMHVYSQWKPSPNTDCFHSGLQHQESDEFQVSRNLRDEDLRTLANETSQRRIANVSSMPHLSRVSSINLTMLDAKKKRGIQNENVSMDYMPDYGLFEASRIACPVLPQYHPKQLMELLNSGKIRWVKAILAHLVRCISSSCPVRADDENIVKSKAGWSRSRTMSVSYMGTTSPLEPRGSTTQIPEELTLDYAEITSISPLPLWTLLIADKETNTSQQNEDKQDYNKLFDGNVDEGDSLDDMLDEDYERVGQKDRRPSVPERQGISYFGPRHGRILSRLLTHTHLPGLSSLDQMHLLALADTVSTCNVDFAERFAIDAQKSAIAKENLTGIPEGEAVSMDSLDDCGLRFLLAMKHYNYLIKCLPLAQRAQFQKQGVSTNNVVWAFHSESEEELLSLIPSYAKGQPKWSVLKELAVGWWITNMAVLKRCIEKIAKAAFQQNQDPLDAAIYYLAMRKKNLVWGLFRNKRDDRMTAFFANNFSEDRWRKAALKNAFALLGKQRFEHAAAFFLLAGALRDAIEVCLNKLNDIQLAMTIARLYEDDMTSLNLKRLMYEEILGCDKDGNNQDTYRAHPDPFLRSMALWILKDHSGSLNTLLLTNVGSMHPQYNDESDKPEGSTANPNVFNFYVYLRTHPLLIRQYIASTAQDKKKGHSVVISGFSYGTETKTQQDKQLTLEDTITPLERQLYFTTAHAHFKAGCPALALEVLSKLPSKVMETNSEDSPSLLNSPSKGKSQNFEINTGTITWDTPKPEAIDTGISTWDTPKPETIDTASALDWSQPVKKESDELVLNWDDDPVDNDDESPPMSMKLDQKKESVDVNKDDAIDEATKASGQLDIMAQQLKFVACLKILMEELSTLATGFEVDGGQLRYQLYVWLEREVDALRQLCNYSVSADGDVAHTTEYESSMIDEPPTHRPGEQPTLHEILVAEKFDFEAKVQRAAKRKKWLKANETLLRTLLSYCSLHGASGGGLASVRMELILLLQELQQEKTQQQLLSPLPFPTTLPLLSASVACNKTVVADPVRHLQSLEHDMLQTMVELRNPPMPHKNTHYCEVFILRDLAVALSACIYQSLCDSDTFVNKHHQSESFPTVAEYEAFSGGHLVASSRCHRRYSTDDTVCITTSPSKWPGVTSLRALLAREKDEDAPKLNILLCEAFVATFMSLFVYALSSCDSHILYRLVGHHFDNNTWSCLFGGGVKKLLRVASTSGQTGSMSLERQDSLTSELPSSTAGGVWNTMTSLTRQRVKLNMKLLGQFTGQQPNMKEDKPTYREQFVSPQMSMISYFLMKPRIEGELSEEIDYDSSDSAVSDLDVSEEEDDIFDTNAKPKSKPKDNIEHMDPNSYSWCIMRLAIVKILQQQLQDFLNVAGIEMQELPVSSPLIHGTLGVVVQWQESLREELDTKGPPPANYIPGCAPDPVPTPGKPAIHKYRSLLEKGNTPFNTRLATAAPVNRLWCYLVRQESIQEIFIRAVFGKRRSLSSILEPSHGGADNTTRGSATGEDKGSDSGTTSLPEPVRIIHKEQDSISAFCLNQVNSGLMALATPREVQEMDISLLLELPSWLEDECEFDIINLNKQADPEPAQPTSFLVIQTAADRPLLAQSPQQNSPQPQSGIASQSGRGASVILKHKIDGIRRVSSHPLLPLYLTGSQDGSVSLWEWGHQTAVATPRPPGTFAKVTRVRFSQHGNKFGVADSDGHLSLFQVACRDGTARPFFNYQCHSKVTSDFVFLGACSLVATAGHGSEGRNVALWDTLLPQNKSLVQGFTCHDQGASALILAPQHQLLISGGKKGYINIFDVRQRQQRNRFQAHDSAIKCLALDPQEEFFVSGAGDGDIKVWGLTVHTLLYSFPGEHPRSSFFKNIGQGVTQLHVDSAGRLFSCGADGSMKVRQLPERDCVVHTYY